MKLKITSKSVGRKARRNFYDWQIYFLPIWLLICLLFSKPINNAANTIGSFLFQYDKNLLYDLLIVFLVVLYGMLRKKNDIYKCNWKSWPLFILLAIIVWYIPNRVGIEPRIKFLQSYSFNEIKLLDSLFVLFLIEIAVERQEKKKYLKKRKELRKGINNKKELSKRSSFITDTAFSPKINHQTDVLGFVNFANRIATEIKTVSSIESVVFGINGEWGEGKTSMINLIRQKLKTEKYTVVDFHPWKTNSGKAMNQLFFEALKDGLKNKIWGINWKIDRYADALLQLDKTGISKTIWQIVFQPDSVEKQKDKLAESMKLLDKNLVVVVDDLDRLAKNEIADVLKLMRDTANFPNLVFLAAYHRAYLDEAIKSEINPHNYKSYMDKIVLWEAPIYKPQPRKYLEILKNLLIEKLPEFEQDINELFDDSNSTFLKLISDDIRSKRDQKKQLINIDTPDDTYAYIFTNLRKVKRFSNYLVFNIKLVQKQVVFNDFYYLYLLRYLYPKLFERFIIAYHELHRNKNFASDKIETEIDKYAELIFNEGDKENPIAKVILSNIIDRSVQVSSNSLVYYKNFLNYFHLGNHNDLTMAEFSAMLKADSFDALKNRINQVFQIGGIFNRFADSSIIKALQENFQFEKGTQSYIDYFKSMIGMAIKYDHPEFHKECHNRMEHICLKKEYGIDIQQVQSEIKRFIIQEQIQSDFQYFIYLLDKTSSYILASDAFEIAKENFNNYISSGKEIAPELLNLFYCSSQSTDKNGNMIEDSEIILKMKQKASEQPNKFIEFIVVKDGNIKHSSDPDNYSYRFVSFLLKIFTSYDEFISFLENTDFGNESNRAKLYLKYIYQAFPDKNITIPYTFLPENNDYENLFAGLDTLDVLLDWKLRARIDEMMSQRTN